MKLINTGAHETLKVKKYYSQNLNEEKAKTLLPQSDVTIAGYVGDPANYEKGIDTIILTAQEYAYRIMYKLQK